MSKKEQQILSEYKQYDYVNQTNNRPLVKIFVSYIKPSFLFKSEILTPVHLGKAVEKDSSKDGALNEQDLKWLHDNCEFNDDFEGGISEYNRRIGFLTGTYWAWKNYEKLGNPKYFGSFGYRRLFKADFLKDLEDYDCIIPYKVDCTKSGPTVKEHVIKVNGQKTMDVIEKTLQKIHPEDYADFCNYLQPLSGYLYEIYVMKKELFFNFCEWIFPLLFELLKIPPQNYGFDSNDKSLEAQFVQKSGEKRDVAYAIEILTGYYCHKLNICDTIKSKQQECEYAYSNNIENNRTKLIMELIKSRLAK